MVSQWRQVLSKRWGHWSDSVRWRGRMAIREELTAQSKATRRPFPALRCHVPKSSASSSPHTLARWSVTSTPMDSIFTIKIPAPKSGSSHQSFIPIFRLKVEHSLAISNWIFHSNSTCLEVTFPSANFSSYTPLLPWNRTRKPSFSWFISFFHLSLSINKTGIPKSFLISSFLSLRLRPNSCPGSSSPKCWNCLLLDFLPSSPNSDEPSSEISLKVTPGKSSLLLQTRGDLPVTNHTVTLYLPVPTLLNCCCLPDIVHPKDDDSRRPREGRDHLLLSSCSASPPRPTCLRVQALTCGWP